MKIAIPFEALVAFALSIAIGCSHAAPDSSASDTHVEQSPVEQLANSVCACTDLRCASAVLGRAGGGAMSNDPAATPEEAAARKAAGERIQACLTRIATVPPPAPQ
jgi:hypothetical protein